MKKVLIITYYWPPSGGPGVQRTLYFAKYLRENGWEPIIYSIEDANYPVIDELLFKDIPEGIKVLKGKSIDPYKAYKRLFSFSKDKKLNTNIIEGKTSLLHKMTIWIRGNFFIPDARMLWIKPSVSLLRRYLEENPVDVIFSSSPPQSVHIIAKKLNKITNIPWVADFRDPWTRISYFDKLMLSSKAKRIHQEMEKSVLKSASRVVAVTKTLVKDFEEISGRKVDLISNGFDDQKIVPKLKLDKSKFVISYVGSLDEARNPRKLWQAIAEICRVDHDFKSSLELKFAGRISPSIFEAMEEYGLKDAINYLGYLSHEEVYKLYSTSNLLLLIGIPNDPCVLTGKIFEYLQSQRTVLSISPEGGDIEVMLRETGAGLNADFMDKDTVQSNLVLFWNYFKEGRDYRKKGAELFDIYQFSRRNLTKKLAVLFDEIIQQKHDNPLQ